MNYRCCKCYHPSNTSIKVLSIDHRFGIAGMMNLFICNVIAIGELFDFHWNKERPSFFALSKPSFIEIKLPVWFVWRPSVVKLIFDSRPYLANKRLTSWYKLTRGTPNTNKCRDSFTIVYVWKCKQEKNVGQIKFLSLPGDWWKIALLPLLRLIFVHCDNAIDLYNTRGAYDVTNLAFLNFPFGRFDANFNVFHLNRCNLLLAWIKTTT